MKNTKRKIFITLGFGLWLGMVIFSYRTVREAPQDVPQTSDAIASSSASSARVSISAPGIPSLADLPEKKFPPAYTLSTEAKNILQKCGIAAGGETDLGPLILPLLGKAQKSEVVFENRHFKRSDQSILRLHIVSGERSQGAYELKLFGEDAEAYPIPLEIPSELRSLDLHSQILRLQSGNELRFWERKEVLHYPDGKRIEVEWENGQVRAVSGILSTLGRLQCAPDYEKKTVECDCEPGAK